ncbi:hypothetical protein, partial [Streptomyces paromomycinus]|uniref:hypothetical protein n=1 Tax=Streptomyces paromomycinus TaxID=92743 RepID=UPI0033C154D5
NAVALSVQDSWCADDDGFGGVAGGLGPGAVFGSLESIVGHLAFDDTGLAADSSGWQQSGKKVVPEPCEGGDKQFRGKRRPAWW